MGLLVEYQPGCKGCDISQESDKKIGGIIELEGDWILNHYGGDEGFLGWFALQPRYHRMEISDLTDKETIYLGRNIQKIENTFRNYWNNNFNDDSIERVYIVYFFDSVFDLPKITNYHLHFHLIVRTKEIGELLRKGRYCTAPNINAWMIHRIIYDIDFPPKYKRDDGKVIKLMTYLRSVLSAG